MSAPLLIGLLGSNKKAQEWRVDHARRGITRIPSSLSFHTYGLYWLQDIIVSTITLVVHFWSRPPIDATRSSDPPQGKHVQVRPLGTPRLFGNFSSSIPLFDELVLFQPTHICASVIKIMIIMVWLHQSSIVIKGKRWTVNEIHWWEAVWKNTQERIAQAERVCLNIVSCQRRSQLSPGGLSPGRHPF